MGAAGATGRAGAGVWGGSLFPLGHVRLGGSGYLPMQIHAPLWGAAPLHGARESKDRCISSSIWADLVPFRAQEILLSLSLPQVAF